MTMLSLCFEDEKQEEFMNYYDFIRFVYGSGIYIRKFRGLLAVIHAETLKRGIVHHLYGDEEGILYLWRLWIENDYHEPVLKEDCVDLKKFLERAAPWEEYVRKWGETGIQGDLSTMEWEGGRTFEGAASKRDELLRKVGSHWSDYTALAEASL